MEIGLRVLRGPNWTMGDEDGGEGHVGTIVEQASVDTVHVIWDGGQVSTCRGGLSQGGYDLRILDNATVGIKHPQVVCDECQETDILGIRWKCAECDNFDLCSLCYFSDRHDLGHQFWRIETPESPLGCKVEVAKLENVFNMCSGGKGAIGQVVEVFTPAAHSARSVVRVEWENGIRNVYRMGFKGKVDLQYEEEAPGVECYLQHLPVFKLQKYTKAKLSEDIVDGDSVCINVGKEELEQLQKARSGWAVGMMECFGKVGKVQGFASNGDAIVSFGAKKYRLFPGALKKVTQISVGSRVRVLDDEDRVRILQDGHGGYNSKMRSCLGKVGEVIKVDDDGDLVVKFNGCQWAFNPMCCTPAPNEDVDTISLTHEDDDSDGMSLGQGGNLLWLLAAFSQAAKEAAKEVPIHIFLKAIADREEIPALEMLKKNPRLATAQIQGLSALHIAANRGLLSITRALIAAGANINERDRDGDTPLTAGMSNIEIAEFLIKQGCDVTIANKNGQTASHMAARSGYSSLLKLLLSKGADFNAQDDAGDTPLHDAISKSETSAAEVIISWPKLDIRRRNKKGFPPLHFTALRDEPAITELLLKKDRTIVDEQKDDGFTPLHVCAFNDHHGVMRILIEKGRAMLDKRNNENQTPLHVACHQGYFNSVQLLVEKGADVNSRDSTSNTPLHLALVSAGGSSMDPKLRLLMMLAGQSDRMDEDQCIRIAHLLIEKGADPTARNNDRHTPLDLCRSDKAKRAVRCFIDERSQVTQASSSRELDREPNKCVKCRQREQEILLVPCGHRVVCRPCCNNLRLCPQCSSQVKSMFDKNGKDVKESCSIM
ncbi:hypothetical protein C0Q70_04109 [Pomacea canaliculata]|uniref:RING-type E3 ubiquitin transferase n=1 Tax=Pomacea canaliculata TaxID=400727 RepID=A0A2T7PUK9_POMCA|nr:hypothetical protein C0Q70_04109 [Pomacea canaliculata]